MAKKPTLPKIVVIGGGTGTFVLLRGLKQYPVSLTAIVTMSDSGGSNSRIRDEFGLLPTSDIRQCLVALSEENGGVGLLRKLFMYRFDRGKGISGMTFGNLFMAALTDIVGSQREAIRQTGKVLRIKGRVVPVSFTDTNLYAEYENGHIVSEEHLIDEPKHDGTLRIVRTYLRPSATANEDALAAITSADMIVIGPGDLYTSLIPNLLVKGISAAIRASRAKKVYVLNLMTKYGQTYNFTASDHLKTIQKYLTTDVDCTIVHKGSLPKYALSLYATYHELPVKDNLGSTNKKVVRANLASSSLTKKPASDKLVRSLIRHDSDKLASQVFALLRS